MSSGRRSSSVPMAAIRWSPRPYAPRSTKRFHPSCAGTTRTGRASRIYLSLAPPGTIAKLIFIPTNGGLTCVLIGWPNAEFGRVRANLEHEYQAALAMLAPHIADRIGGSARAERYYGMADLPNYFRQPHRSGLGAGGRRRLPQGPRIGARHRRCGTGRRPAGRSSACWPRRRQAHGAGAGRLRAAPQRRCLPPI